MLRDLLIFAAGAVSLLILQICWGAWLVRRDQAVWLGWRRPRRTASRRFR